MDTLSIRCSETSLKSALTDYDGFHLGYLIGVERRLLEVVAFQQERSVPVNLLVGDEAFAEFEEEVHSNATNSIRQRGFQSSISVLGFISLGTQRKTALRVPE